MTSPWVSSCYAAVSGLFLRLLSWAILTLPGKVKDKLAVPAPVRARAAAAAPREELRLRGRERVCSGPARKTDFASVHHPRDSGGDYV